ncbi:hypothetical protein ACFY05_33055 [Microtetraspora fusca]|uniref:DUF3040 domain-containing protein n=1 Tax=Microtetraspora fusca TaxID=1997 RepID=A0ABW6VHD3_MICFU
MESDLRARWEAFLARSGRTPAMARVEFAAQVLTLVGLVVLSVGAVGAELEAVVFGLVAICWGLMTSAQVNIVRADRLARRVAELEGGDADCHGS